MLDSVAWWRWLLLIVFFGALGAVWWWSKAGELKSMLTAKKEKPRLRVIERRYLGPKAAVVLVEVDGRPYLLAHSGTAVAWQTLSEPEVKP